LAPLHEHRRLGIFNDLGLTLLEGSLAPGVFGFLWGGGGRGKEGREAKVRGGKQERVKGWLTWFGSFVCSALWGASEENFGS